MRGLLQRRFQLRANERLQGQLQATMYQRKFTMGGYTYGAYTPSNLTRCALSHEVDLLGLTGLEVVGAMEINGSFSGW